MKNPRHNDAVHWFIGEIVSRVIAESGRACDRSHLGKIVLQSLKDDPDFILQIDGATGEQETSGSVLERSVRCAVAMKKLGLVRGDVVVLMAPNHIDLAIPFYAAMYIGVGMAAIDRTLSGLELKSAFNVVQPKAIFCQSDRAPFVQRILKELGSRAHVITFDEGGQSINFAEFLDEYGEGADVNTYRPDDFDPEQTVAWLISTSGTTGLPKIATTTHKTLAINAPYFFSSSSEFPSPTKISLVVSQLQWLTALLNNLLSAVLRYTRLQSSSPMTQEHTYYLINKYKPTFVIMSPTMLATLMKPDVCDKCDFTSFELIMIGGSAVPQNLIEEIKKKSPKTEVFNAYGITEISTMGFRLDYQAPKSIGKPFTCFQYRLVDIVTHQDISEPNVTGELWMKGPGVFKGYYNNPAATKEAFAEGGWFKTGDLFYRDENWNFYFVERTKLLLKYNSHHISPLEIEEVIRQHPGVLDVAVTGLPNTDCGDLPLACVVIKPGHSITTDEIKNLVKDNLSDAKQLRGGVIYLPEMPMTPSTKINRAKVKEIALRAVNEKIKGSKKINRLCA